MAQLHLKPTTARRFDAYRVALELVALVRPFAARIRREDKELANQLTRALPSIPQNLAEGMRRVGDDRAYLLTVVLGSADEVRTIVDVALVSGMIEAEEAAHAEELADRVCAMVFRVREKLA